MKFTISSDSLARAIAMPVKAATTKGVNIPALHCILITATAETTTSGHNLLTITGGDGEMAVTNAAYVIRDAGEGEEKACVDAKLFSDAVKALPEQPITVTVADKTAMIVYDGGEYTMPSYPADEYPVLEGPADTDTSLTAINIEDTILAAAEFAAEGKKAEIRPVMNAVCLSLYADTDEDVSYEVCGSDGMSLFISSRGGCGQSPNAILMPARVARMCTMFNVNALTFTAGERVAKVSAYEQSIIFRTIESSYPNYHAVMPTTPPTVTMDIRARDLIAVLRRALMFAAEETSCVVIRSHADRVDIITTDRDYARSFREKLPVISVTDDFEIGLNGERLVSAVQALMGRLPEANIRIHFWSPKHAVTIKSLSAPDDEDTTVLQMPILI